MKLAFKVWKFEVKIDLFDLDISDGDIACRIVVSWK